MQQLLMSLSNNSNICAISWLLFIGQILSSFWTVFSFFVYLAIFDWMSDIVNFNAGYFEFL
jgi:hypothetical protein